MSSFSKKIKSEILLDGKLKRCCAFSFVYGFCFLSERANDNFLLKKTNAENAESLNYAISMLFKNKPVKFDSRTRQILINSGVVRYFTIAEYKENVFKCDNCTGYFLRALFLNCGTVNDPENSYRLELVFDDEYRQNAVYELLTQIGFTPKKSVRTKKHIIYIKDSEQIADFLALIGANNATFEVINSRILKEIRNNANRAANCDAANINKSINASKKYINAISELQKNGEIDLLPEQLKETALKRMEFQELNFEQLGKKFEPAITKSGIYHRLEKILDFYNKTQNK